MVQQVASAGGMPAASEQAPVGPPQGGPQGAPDAAPAQLDSMIQQQQGVPPEQKRQMALQKLLKLRAAIDQMIRILQGQASGQPPQWMAKQEATEMARAPGHPGIPSWMAGQGGAPQEGGGV